MLSGFSLVVFSVSEEQMTTESEGAALIAALPQLSAFVGSHGGLEPPLLVLSVSVSLFYYFLISTFIFGWTTEEAAQQMHLSLSE